METGGPVFDPGGIDTDERAREGLSNAPGFDRVKNRAQRPPANTATFSTLRERERECVCVREREINRVREGQVTEDAPGECGCACVSKIVIFTCLVLAAVHLCRKPR